MKYSEWQHANKVQPAHEGIYQWRCKIAQPTVARTHWHMGGWHPSLYMGGWHPSLLYATPAPDKRCEHCQWRGGVD